MITLSDDQIEKEYRMHHTITDIKNVLQDLKDDAIILALHTSGGRQQLDAVDAMHQHGI
ncbi:hypothetical protein [Salinicoccus halodurans]|uniref:hypothetical protein n=1 Tax=Salinicoccus halodurans TaxID=407035 RepID=UPI001F218B56|nr:hypothetical protein [Salinicoccus halodurans]